VGQELPRCTGFCLGLRTQDRKGTKLGGFKYGVWQLHILLMGYGVGAWAFPQWIDLAMIVIQHHQSHPFGLVAGFSFGVYCSVPCDFSLHWWSVGIVCLYRISSALSMFPLRWEYTRSVASFVRVGVSGVVV